MPRTSHDNNIYSQGFIYNMVQINHLCIGSEERQNNWCQVKGGKLGMYDMGEKYLNRRFGATAC